MALSHWEPYIDECPYSDGNDDRYVAEEASVTCLPCLRRMAAGSTLSEGAESLDGYENPYLLGYCDGIEACFAQILAHSQGDAHYMGCTCDQCRLVHHVLVSTLRRIREEPGSDTWIDIHRN